MKHLGDITAIDGRTAPTVDVVIGGSPCQGLSIAGKRQGLTDERSRRGKPLPPELEAALILQSRMD